MVRITREYLQSLYSKKKFHGCVAIARGENSKIYYAVNGGPETEKEGLRLIRSMFGIGSIQCKHNYSFTALKPYVTNDIIDEGYVFCRTLDCFPDYRKLPFQLRSSFLFVNKAGIGPYNGRYFYCAEKKIMGYMIINGTQMKDLYTTTAPCYHCLSVVDTIKYLSDDYQRIRVLRKEDKLSQFNGSITLYFYKHLI